MPSTTNYKFGEVVLVPFPFTDQSATKKRPAVVVSSEAFHRHRSDLILCAITSTKPSNRAGEAPVAEWRQAGLLKPSVFKPILTTLTKDLVLQSLGRLTLEDRETLRRILDTILGESPG